MYGGLKADGSRGLCYRFCTEAIEPQVTHASGIVLVTLFENLERKEKVNKLGTIVPLSWTCIVKCSLNILDLSLCPDQETLEKLANITPQEHIKDKLVQNTIIVLKLSTFVLTTRQEMSS